jgi:hypothetical protein
VMRRLRQWWFVASVLLGIALDNYRRRRAERDAPDVVAHEPEHHLLDRIGHWRC